MKKVILFFVSFILLFICFVPKPILKVSATGEVCLGGVLSGNPALASGACVIEGLAWILGTMFVASNGQALIDEATEIYTDYKEWYDENDLNNMLQKGSLGEMWVDNDLMQEMMIHSVESRFKSIEKVEQLEPKFVSDIVSYHNSNGFSYYMTSNLFEMSTFKPGIYESHVFDYSDNLQFLWVSASTGSGVYFPYGKVLITNGPTIDEPNKNTMFSVYFQHGTQANSLFLLSNSFFNTTGVYNMDYRFEFKTFNVPLSSYSGSLPAGTPIMYNNWYLDGELVYSKPVKVRIYSPGQSYTLDSYYIDGLGFQHFMNTSQLTQFFNSSNALYLEQLKKENNKYLMNGFDLLQKDYNSWIEKLPGIVDGTYQPNPIPTVAPTIKPTSVPVPTLIPGGVIPFPTAPALDDVESLPLPTANPGIYDKPIDGSLLGGLIGGLFNWLIEALQKLFAFLLAPLIALMEWLGSLIMAGLNGLLNGLSELLNSILSSISTILNNILTAINSLILDLVIAVDIETYFNDFQNLFKSQFKLFFDLSDFFKTVFLKFLNVQNNSCISIPSINYMGYQLSSANSFCLTDMPSGLNTAYDFYLIIMRLSFYTATFMTIFNRVTKIVKKGWK